MNREILFRGKTKKSGEWAEGNYEWYHKPEKHLISSPYSCATVGVIPETVGQFTGLTDKNGVKIFEGDILYIPYRYNVEVVFYKGWFCAVYKGAKGETIYNSITAFDDFEVIGNIYDNPKLLEENNNGA